MQMLTRSLPLPAHKPNLRKLLPKLRPRLHVLLPVLTPMQYACALPQTFVPSTGGLEDQIGRGVATGLGAAVGAAQGKQ